MDIERLIREATECLEVWREYEQTLAQAGLEAPLKVTAIGWKVADSAAFAEAQDTLLPLSEQLHVGTVDNRFIGSYVLKKPIKNTGVTIIKVLQRRPGSKDLLGLDHLDFYVKDISKAKEVLQKTSAVWEEQANDVHSWLSIRFGNNQQYEAKFVDHIVLHVALKELQASIDKVL